MSRSTSHPGALRRGMHLGIVASLLLLTIGVLPASAATLGAFPSSSASVAGSLTNPGNAYADDGAYAIASMAKNSTMSHDFGDFGFDSIPVGATIGSATLEIQFHVSTNAGADVVSAQAWVSGAASGSAVTNSAQPTADTILSTSSLGISSRSQLLNGTFKVRVTDTRPNTGPSATTFSLDYVKVTVVYTVPDTTPPVVTVPADLTLEATGPSGAVATFSASATDDVDGALTATCAPASGSTFPLGTTTVTCSASDAATNTASATFTVTVEDTTAPTVSVPADLTLAATGPSGAVATFSASASDLVDGALAVTCAPASGSTFPVGTTTVTCSATDAATNTGSATFTVTVDPFLPPDTTPPVVTVPADLTLEATGPSGAVATFSASATDDVDGALTATCAPASGSTFPLGTTTVTCSASDAATNTGSATFTVTVEDTTAPTVSVPADLTLAATGPSGAVATFSASASDLVDGALAVTCAPASGSTFPVGTTTVTCSASDTATNTVSATFTVTVGAWAGADSDLPDTSIASPAGQLIGWFMPFALAAVMVALFAIPAWRRRSPD